MILIASEVSSARTWNVDTLARLPAFPAPSGLVCTPGSEGTLYIVDKEGGRVRVYRNELGAKAFVNLTAISHVDRGRPGIAVHPQYPESSFVYLAYTRRSDNALVISRYLDSNSVGVHPSVIYHQPAVQGAEWKQNPVLHIGPDEKLYASIPLLPWQAPGNERKTRRVFFRSIVRLNPDGSIPEDNPHPGSPLWFVSDDQIVDFTFDTEGGMLLVLQRDAEGRCFIHRVSYDPEVWAETPDPRDAVSEVLYCGSWRDDATAPTGLRFYGGREFPRLTGAFLSTDNAPASVNVLRWRDGDDSLRVESLPLQTSTDSRITALEPGSDGSLYVLLKHGSVETLLLRLRPVAPEFASVPPSQATQDEPYVYTPNLDESLSALSIMQGPRGFTLTDDGHSIRWVPTNEQALEGTQEVVLRAENGAGHAEQRYTIEVANVNDPPLPFYLTSPASDTTLSFHGVEPAVSFSWSESRDPDRDTIRYTIQIDTVARFDSPALMNVFVAEATTSIRRLPSLSEEYYWRVIASDGAANVLSSTTGRLRIAYRGKSAETAGDAAQPVLEQNFPNPFNPSTFIKYSIPKSGHVRLAVFNLLGQELSLLFEGVQTAGTYEFEFKSGELPSGIYFYRIQAPDFVETKKMIIAR